MSVTARTPSRVPTATPADVQILSSLARYAYLTAEQIRRLHYGPGVITHVRARTKRLVDSRHVLRLEQPHFSRAGSAPNVFRLATRGYRLLAELGIPAIPLPDEKPASFLFYTHTLCLNDLLIAAELMVRLHPAFSIEQMLHERALQRRPTRVTLTDGSQVSVVPDAFLKLLETESSGPGFVTNIVFELDMGTRDQRSWRAKVAGLQAFIEGPYPAEMGAESLTIAVLTPLGQRRADELLSWTEAELRRLNRSAYGALFCFAGVEPTAVSPEALYFSANWRQPFRSDLVPLVLRGEEAS